MKITLSNKEIDKIDISNLLLRVTDSVEKENVSGLSGEQHYRLLIYLSSLFNNSLFCDIGTFKGSSAIALSQNRTNKVISFGIEDRVIPAMETVRYLPQTINLTKTPNIDFIITQDFLYYLDIILKSQLIFLDIDHSGKKEKELYELLVKHNYKGILLMDDIHIYKVFGNKHEESLKGMEDFWNSIKNNKNVYDISKYGHGPSNAPTGTGIIIFNETKLILK